MRKPQHSTVVAYLALFVAMGGTSYAAVKLPANSVGSRELKNRSVRMADLAKDARPSKDSKLFRAAVTDVVLDPNTQAVVDSLAGAVKGEKGEAGPQGPAGAAVQGPAGDPGRPGEALAYGHVFYGGSVDQDGTTSNVKVMRADTDLADGVRHFCIDMQDGTRPHNLTATVDGDDPSAPSQPAAMSVRKAPANGPCAGSAFEVLTLRSFFFAVN